MGRSVYVEKYVEVEVELEDFSDDELIDEMQNRGIYTPSVGNGSELIDKIYHLRRQGRSYERELDEYLYNMTGRAI